MLTSEIKTYTYSDGEICRVQIVRADSWQQAEFVKPPHDPASFEGICHIYRSFLVPAAPYVFGKLRMVRDGDRSRTVETIRGRLPFRKTIPIGTEMGRLTQIPDCSGAVVNSSFFILDPFDCATGYDVVGTPFGLMVKDGCVISPPLFGREALMVYDNGEVKIEEPLLDDLRIEIAGHVFEPGRNAVVCERPEHAFTWNRRRAEYERDIVIVGRRVVDVHSPACTPVPASGFVLRVKSVSSLRDTASSEDIRVGDEVTYHGMEHVAFAVSVGNSVMRDGVGTEEFISRFYNVRKPWATEFPPSLYPLDFEHARAARIVLGADEDDRPVLLWAEGAGKCGYEKGVESAGASLKELADICADLRIRNAVNLDGGGSAQIVMNGVRSLKISDRDPSDNSETERAVPVAIMFRDSAVAGRKVSYTLSGTVVHGKGAGHRHGMPTANIAPDGCRDDSFAYPPYGVYGGEITVEGDPNTYITLVNIGTRPSDDDSPVPTVEALIQDFDGDIYDRRVTLRLDRYIRNIRKFAGGLDEVREQIGKDVREYLKMRA